MTFARVLEQQPARPFDHPSAGARRLIVRPRGPRNAVGLVHAHPVDDLAAVLGDDVEEIVDQRDVGTLRAHLFEVRRAHVHHHRFKPRTAHRARSVKNARRSSRPRPRPTQSTRLVGHLDDDGGIAMPALNRELVDRDHAHRTEVDRAQAALQGALIDLLHGIPAHPEPRGHLLDREHLREARDLLGQARRHALVAIEPRHRFDRRPTPRALEPRARKDEPRIGLENRQVPHAPLGDVVNLHDDFAAATAALGIVRQRPQFQHDPRHRVGLVADSRCTPVSSKPSHPPSNAVISSYAIGPLRSIACVEYRRLSLLASRNSSKNLF